MVDERRRAVRHWQGQSLLRLYSSAYLTSGIIILQLIEHIITTHPAKDDLYKKAKEEGKNIYSGMSLFLLPSIQIAHQSMAPVLHDTLERLRVESNVGSYTELTKELHLYPDFHGSLLRSRTPFLLSQ